MNETCFRHHSAPVFRSAVPSLGQRSSIIGHHTRAKKTRPSDTLPISNDREDPAFLREQVVTYIGNKRSLLGAIRSAVDDVREATGKDRLRILDGFAGSGVVSRQFKSYASELVVNDLERYAEVLGRCFLANRTDFDYVALASSVDRLNRRVDSRDRDYRPGFIERLYAPGNDNNIRAGERVFYTRENARRLDQFRTLIGEEDPGLFDLLLGPLLSAASVHANTAGVFKGFYKDRETGVGKFGGSGADALARILGEIRLMLPVLSRFSCDTTVFRRDTNELVREVGGFDLAYFDPPYNQHPYGSNYFMLNLLVDYSEPDNISSVSGIPANWNRSNYNVKRRSLAALTDLVQTVDATFVLVSFNDEGFVSPDDLRVLLGSLGTFSEVQIRYNTFRGSRNLRERSPHVTEHLYLLQKG